MTREPGPSPAPPLESPAEPDHTTLMEGPEDNEAKAPWWILVSLSVVLVLLLAAIGALDVETWLLAAPGAMERSSRSGTWISMPLSPEAARRGGGEPLRERRLAAAPPADARLDGPVRVSEFIDSLGSQMRGPKLGMKGRRFARAFLAEPRLRTAYRDYAKAKRSGQERSAVAFVRQISQMPEFQELQVRFLRTPENLPASQNVLESPSLRSFFEDWRRAFPEAGEEPATAQAPGRFLGTATGSSPPSSPPQARAPGLDDTPARGAAGSGPLSGDAYGANAPRPGAAAHEVATRLRPLAAATSSAPESFCKLYGFLCDGGAVMPQFRPLLDATGLIEKHGLWGACHTLGIYSACATACQAKGGCKITPAWRACLSVEPEATCRPLCLDCDFNAPE